MKEDYRLPAIALYMSAAILAVKKVEFLAVLIVMTMLARKVDVVVNLHHLPIIVTPTNV